MDRPYGGQCRVRQKENMKTFLVKFILAAAFLATLAACTGQKNATVVADKGTINSACSAVEPSNVVKHWVAYTNHDIKAMIATYDPKSSTAPNFDSLTSFFNAVKASNITLDSIVWVATCPLPDGSAYSFFLVTDHNATKSVTQWYVVTTSAEGLIENVE